MKNTKALGAGSSYKGHGMGGAPGQRAGSEPLPLGLPPKAVYNGSPLYFEGGVRAPRTAETLPAAYPHRQKLGYNERRSSRTDGTLHGVPGVEGIRAGYGNDGNSGATADSSAGGTSVEGDHGYTCKHHGCGMKHGSSAALAVHVAKSHGTSYKLGQESRGETEDDEEWDGDDDEDDSPLASSSGTRKRRRRR